MAVTKLEGFIYTCDKCGEEHVANGMTGHYTQSTPPAWMTITWWCGEDLGYTRGSMLLCDKCMNGVLGEILKLSEKS